MNAYIISLVIFACVFGGALLGALLRTSLPDHHLSSESKEIVRLGTGLVGTMTALVLGLLVASAKSSYDTDKTEVITLASKIVFMDRLLAHYGPEAAPAREALKKSAVTAIERMWPAKPSTRMNL